LCAYVIYIVVSLKYVFRVAIGQVYMVRNIAFKLTMNEIIALELRKNMDIDKVLLLAFGLELI